MANIKKVVKKTTTKKSTKKVVKKKATKGRPTLYKPDMANKFLEYVESGMEMIEATHNIGIVYSTLLEWVKIHDDFSKVHKKAKEIIENRIVQSANIGSMNPAWAMFRLKCQHGYIERDKRENIQLKRDELDAKISGDIVDEKDYTFNFGIAPNPHLVEE